MSFISGGVASGPSAGLRFASTRGRIQGSPMNGVNYPSPFFDIAHTYLPATVKQLFRWCRYYFLTNPLINATVFKLSEYPITDIVIDHESEEVVKLWTEYFQDHLRWRAFQVEVGLDYHCYGNSATSVGFPFKKYLQCSACKFKDRADKIRRNWIFTSFTFRLTCPRCGSVGEAVVSDHYMKNASDVKMIRWNPEDIEISYNDVTGNYTHYYNIPATVRNDAIIGRKDTVESIPQVFIQAMRENKGVIFSKDNFFHMRRATLATQDRGWGIPLLLPVLKDTFYLQVMKKAQEAILLEHIVPLRVLFPQASSGTSDPYCVSPDTLIETVQGLQPASEIQTGDYLRSHTGAWRRVEAVKARPVPSTEKVFSVRVDSLSAFPFEASEDHPVLAVRRTHRHRGQQVWVDPEFVPVKDLRVGDYVAYPCKRVTSSARMLDMAEYVDRAATEKYVYRRLSQEAAEAYEWLEENGDPSFSWGERAAFLAERGWSEQAYATAYSMRREGSIDRVPRLLPVGQDLATLVGYFLAEGSLKSGTPSFSLGSDEGWIANEIEQAANALGFRASSRYLREEQHSLTVDVQDVLLGALLEGLCGRGFANKRVPQVLSEASDAVVLRMLSCLFAGDGCNFQTGTNRVALKMANPSVVLEARRLLLSFGLIGGITKEAPKEKGISKQPSYNLAYNGEQAEALRLLFLGGVLPQVPWSKLGVLRGDYVFHRIASLDEVTSVSAVIGFQMAGDKSFCVAGVATHNTSINLVDWRDHVANEIARWRYDNNYIPIMPLPIGNQTIGGDGRALLLTQEISVWSDQITMGMGVPLEFVKGGMSYAGTNVSMRMLENAFLGYILRQRQLARWVMQSVSSFMGWPMAKIRFKPFKMADDIQRKAYRFQLNQAGKISDTTLLADDDLDQSEENKIIIREADSRVEATKKQQLAMADIQGQAQLVMTKYQVQAQQTMQQASMAGAAPGEPGATDGAAGAAPPAQGGGGGGFGAATQSPLSLAQRMPQNENGQVTGLNVDIPSMAKVQANLIRTLGPQQREMALSNLRMMSPELEEMVEQLLSQDEGQQGGDAGVDMRPLPEQRSPRRAAGMV